MVGDIQPLDQSFAIVKPDGMPTEYFIWWAQQRQIDIQNGITAAQAQQLIDDWAAGRQIIAGSGLDGGGYLSADVTLTADVQEILDQLSTTHGDIIYRDSAAWAVLAAGTSGQVLQTNGAGADPSWVNPSAGGGGYEAGSPSVPLVSTFTWANQGTSTATDGTNAILISPQLNYTARTLYKTAPSAPFDVYARMTSSFFSTGAVTVTVGTLYGIVLRDSADGEQVSFALEGYRIAGDEQTVWEVSIRRWTSAGAISATPLTQRISFEIKWLRVNVTSTTITCYVSFDGWNWITIGTETIATYIDAVNQYGILTAGDTNNTSQQVLVSYFSTTAPT